MAPFAHKVIRTLFGAGEHVAPALAGQDRLRAFLPHAQSRQARRARAHGGRARRRLAGRGAQALPDDAHRPRHRLRVPAGGRRERLGTVLVIHGWGSRTEYMKALIESFRDAGYRVVALDLPGPRPFVGPPPHHAACARRRARRRRVVRPVRGDRRPFLRRRGRRQCRRRLGQGHRAARRRPPGADRRAELDARAVRAISPAS